MLDTAGISESHTVKWLSKKHLEDSSRLLEKLQDLASYPVVGVLEGLHPGKLRRVPEGMRR